MRRPPRAAVVIAAFLLTSCSAFQSSAASLPDGYYFPKHRGSDSGPSGGNMGVLVLTDGCFRLGRSLLIWPEKYSMVATSGTVAVSGDGYLVGEGSLVDLSGGGYETKDELPDAAAAARDVPCDGPYYWVTRIEDVGD